MFDRQMQRTPSAVMPPAWPVAQLAAARAEPPMRPDAKRAGQRGHDLAALNVLPVDIGGTGEVRWRNGWAIQRAAPNSFSAAGINFSYNPLAHQITPAAAVAMTQPLAHGEVKATFGGSAGTGVKQGDVGSYAAAQYYEKTGDKLTPDHQPSGAAIKEAIRQKLHGVLAHPLTRLQAKNAYARAVTLVMNEVWHRLESRTYGGRNNAAQIKADASDLLNAAIEDFKKTVPELKKSFTDAEVEEVWKNLEDARTEFYKSGDITWIPK